MNLELIVILALAIISIFTLFISFVFFRKNKKLLDEKNILESLVIKNSASNRLVDSLESFLEKKDNAEKKLCDSVRLVSSASTVIYSEMNKKDGSFKPVFYSSSEDVNIDEFSTEYVDDKTLAIVAGSEGTYKISRKSEDDFFPKWFDSIEFENVITLPIIMGFETSGCLYVFLSNKLENNIDELLRNIWIITNLFQKTEFKENKVLFETNNEEMESIKDIDNQTILNTISLDENLELLKFKDKEISLSNSEYLIMKRLFDKNGEVLSYTEIENILWPNKDGINKSAMRLHIHRLRDKSKNISENLDVIKTVRGKGIFLDKSLM